MTKALLAIATVADLGLAALLVAVSGFMFGGGPESMHAGSVAAVAYSAAVIACVAAPILGFVFNSRAKTGLGMVIAWLPPVGALVALMIPAPY